MFSIDDKMNIEINRGDIAAIEVKPLDKATGSPHTMKKGDIVRLTVCEENNYNKVVLQKDVEVSGETTVVEIALTSSDTKIGKAINKPKVYYYSIELNPDTAQQTIVGHTKKGPKLFTVYPEGGDKR